MANKSEVDELLSITGWKFEIDEKKENYKVQTCPYCENSNFNFEIHISKGIYNCWVCSEQGGFAKLKKAFGAAEPTAKRLRHSIVGPKSDFTEAAHTYHQRIFSRQEVLIYLKGRGFTDASIRNFKLGAQRKGGVSWLTIPHFQGDVVTNIKYRSVPPAGKKWRQEKQAQKILFNADILSGVNEVVLVEGELKAIALHQIGITNVVALTGGVKNVPDEWIDLLRPMRRVFLCLDSDEPGQIAAKEITRRIGIESCVNVLLPDAKDPDEYLFGEGHSKDDFEKLLKAAKPFELAECIPGLVNLEKAKIEKVDFAWPPYLPIGKLTVAEGDPGTGKTFLALEIASAFSRGTAPFPPTLDMPRKTLILSGEDGIEDTIVPRLKAMNAKLGMIKAYRSPLNLGSKGLEIFENLCKEILPGLVIIDPLYAYTGGQVDIHRANEVRAVLAPLIDLAARYRFSLLAIRHLSKGDKGKSLYRGLGSIDVTAAARSVLLVGKNPDNAEEKIVCHLKSNLSKPGRSLAYKLENQAVRWKGFSELTAEDLLSPELPTDPSAIEAAQKFLRQELSDGPASVTELKRLALNEKISERTLERAKSTLRILSKREGVPGKSGGGKYLWLLPEHGEAPEGLL